MGVNKEEAFHRHGKFAVAHDPMFAQAGEWDLFAVEEEDSRERLSWLMTLTKDEVADLIAVLSRTVELGD